MFGQCFVRLMDVLHHYHCHLKLNIHYLRSHSSTSKKSELFRKLLEKKKFRQVFKNYFTILEDIEADENNKHNDYNDWHIDHQSVITFPYKYGTTEVDLDFYIDFCQEIYSSIIEQIDISLFPAQR